MAKNNTSLGSLVNLAVLNKLIKKADTLIVGRELNMTYICNGHWIVRIKLLPDAMTRTEIFRALGDFPEDGEALIKANDGAKPYELDKLKTFFSGTFYANCMDTHLSEAFDSYSLRIFFCEDQGQRCYIAIDNKYFDMINEYERAASQKCSKLSPILFKGNYDEVALILPVNYTPCAFLAKI